MSNSINEKTRGFKPVSMEDFSTSYSYNAVGAPLTLKRQGVIAPASEDGSTGYSLSARGGTGSYKWNSAGLLNADSARGIRKTYYNESGQPTSIIFTDGGHLDYTYSTSGELLRVSTYAMLPGGRRPTPVSERCYCGGFVFEGDSLIYANFPGGYFDGEGHAHYRHTDFQGNITMVTDRDGQICQHTGYYPYGEPWREPAGQPYLYGGKERMRDGSLNDYDFSARRLNSALALWTAPDPMARDFSNINPYVYCAGNPIRYVDPTGCVIVGMTNLVEDYLTFINQMKNAAVGSGEDLEKLIKFCDKQIKQIEELKNSKNVYEIRLTDRKHGYISASENADKDNNRNIIIYIPKNEENKNPLVGHEMQHAYQFEKGRLSVLPESIASSLPTLYDRNDEMEAYTVQNICVSGINYFRCPDKRDTYTTITNENNEEIEHNYRWGTETISKLAGNLNDLPRKNKRLRGPNDPVIETLNKNGEIYNRYLK